MKTLGFIGLGSQGASMARSPASLEPFADTPAEAFQQVTAAFLKQALQD